MKRRVLSGAFLAALWLLPLATLQSGCGADVEAGQVVTNDVWFDLDGVAHCPVDAPPPDRWIAPDGTFQPPTAEQLAASVVKPYATVCPNGHPIRWVTEKLPCWRCQGAVRCPECDGTGKDPITGRPCPTCASRDETGRTRGTGSCQECGGTGLIARGPWAAPASKP